MYTASFSFYYPSGHQYNFTRCVRLSDSCIENPTTFMSTLSYGSCPDRTTFQESKPFSNSNTALFELDVNSVTGVLCIRVEVTHQSQPNRPLNTLEQQLTFDSCQSAQIMLLVPVFLFNFHQMIPLMEWFPMALLQHLCHLQVHIHLMVQASQRVVMESGLT